MHIQFKGTFTLYKAKDKYTNFSIKKRNGQDRLIQAPSPGLRDIQDRLNQVLHCIYQPKKSIYSFVRGTDRNIIDRARQHVGKHFVFNIDLEDFFPSIHLGRVRGMFMHKPYCLPEKVATVLAQICCTGSMDSKLPQGAPTSPIISNMICRKLDNDLIRLTKATRCTYTRYADDITFSTDKKNKFPTELAYINTTGEVIIGDNLDQTIVENGFKVNLEKVRLIKQNQRQMVTGLIVNEKINVTRKYRNQLRAMINAIRKHGLENAESDYQERYNKKHRNPTSKKVTLLKVLKGKLNFFRMVRGEEDPQYIKYCKEIKQIERISKLIRLPQTPMEKLREEYKKMKDPDNPLDLTPKQRGLRLERFLKDLFNHCKIASEGGFVRRKGSEQIDGSFTLNGYQHYLIECKWTKQKTASKDIFVLHRKVDRSGDQTMGLFFSINGFASTVSEALRADRGRIFLMDGNDLECVLKEEVDLRVLLEAKINRLNLYIDHFYKAEDFLKEKLQQSLR